MLKLFKLKSLFIAFILCYQRFISPFFPARCRFYPTCSEYTRQSIEKHGVLQGFFKGFKQLLRCHPYYSGSSKGVSV